MEEEKIHISRILDPTFSESYKYLWIPPKKAYTQYKSLFFLRGFLVNYFQKHYGWWLLFEIRFRWGWKNWYEKLIFPSHPWNVLLMYYKLLSGTFYFLFTVSFTYICIMYVKKNSFSLNFSKTYAGTCITFIRSWWSFQKKCQKNSHLLNKYNFATSFTEKIKIFSQIARKRR